MKGPKNVHFIDYGINCIIYISHFSISSNKDSSVKINTPRGVVVNRRYFFDVVVNCIRRGWNTLEDYETKERNLFLCSGDPISRCRWTEEVRLKTPL